MALGCWGWIGVLCTCQGVGLYLVPSGKPVKVVRPRREALNHLQEGLGLDDKAMIQERMKISSTGYLGSGSIRWVDCKIWCLTDCRCRGYK